MAAIFWLILGKWKLLISNLTHARSASLSILRYLRCHGNHLNLKKISYENIFSCITLLLSNENHSFLHIVFLDAWHSKILKNIRCHSNCLVAMVTDLMKINKFWHMDFTKFSPVALYLRHESNFLLILDNLIVLIPNLMHAQSSSLCILRYLCFHGNYLIFLNTNMKFIYLYNFIISSSKSSIFTHISIGSMSFHYNLNKHHFLKFHGYHSNKSDKNKQISNFWILQSFPCRTIVVVQQQFPLIPDNLIVLISNLMHAQWAPFTILRYTCFHGNYLNFLKIKILGQVYF